MPWIIAAMFGLSVAGLASVFLRAIYSGAEAYSGEYSKDTARNFEDIFLFIPPRRIAEAGWAISAALFILVFMLVGSFDSTRGLIGGVAMASLAAFAGLKVPRLLLAILKKRRMKRFNSQLVDTLISMSNALKAGFSITQAFESVVRDGENPIAQEFDVFLQQTRLGVSFSQALDNLEQRVGSEDFTLVVLAIETARKTGGNLTEIFEKIAATIRERIRIENRIHTLTAQGKLQGIVVGSMPVIIGCALMLVDPEMMKPFLSSPIGLVVMVVVAILIVCGGLLIRKIVNIDI